MVVIGVERLTDITDPRAPLPDLSADLLVVCLTADERDEAGYRRTYVEGMSRALEAACRAGRSPRRAVLVSSTGVYGDATGLVDEATTPEPSRATSRVLLEAESAFREAVPHGTVARLSGLYGDREPRIVAQVRRGEDPHPHRWTNRLHRHDAAAAVVHLLTRPEAPDPLYVVTDDEPCTSGELSAYVAALLGISWSVSTPGRSVAEGRCLSNARLVDEQRTHPMTRARRKDASASEGHDLVADELACGDLEDPGRVPRLPPLVGRRPGVEQMRPVLHEVHGDVGVAVDDHVGLREPPPHPPPSPLPGTGVVDHRHAEAGDLERQRLGDAGALQDDVGAEAPAESSSSTAGTHTSPACSTRSAPSSRGTSVGGKDFQRRGACVSATTSSRVIRLTTAMATARETQPSRERTSASEGLVAELPSGKTTVGTVWLPWLMVSTSSALADESSMLTSV